MKDSPARGRRRLRTGRVLLAGGTVLCFCALFLTCTLFLLQGQLLSAPKQEKEESAASEESWALTLVNPWNAISAGYEPNALTELKNGQSVDSRIYSQLQQMMDDCRAAGCEPLICSSYRSSEKQQSLYAATVEAFLSDGCSQAEAERYAGQNVAVPGTSEHQLGLAVDIVDENNQILEEEQENTAAQKWLLENCWRYGFILRYPKDKTDVTGIAYEPWHYRYVGVRAAREITERGICLEEYQST